MTKKLIVLLLFVLLLVPFASIHAQDDPMTLYCANLAEADCDLLSNSGTAMQDIESFGFTMSLDFGIISSAAEMEEINFSIAGGGNLALNLGDYMGLQELALENPEAYMEQLPQIMSELVTGITGEASFLLTLPAEMGIPTGSDLTFDLLMKDGLIYLDAGPIMEMSGQGTGEPMWFGINLAEFYGEAMGDMMGGMDFTSMLNGNMFSTFSSPEYMSQFIQTTRLADEEVMGQSMAVFETSLDYGALLAAPEMHDYLESLYSGMGMSPAEIDTILGMVSTMFSDAEVKFAQYIGLNDNFIHRFTMTMGINIDGASFGEPDAGTTQMNMLMDFTLSNFNEPVEVEVPANATVLPTSMLTGQTGA